MSSTAESWLLAAKIEEKRLVGEIAKTDLFRQLEAVRAVIAVYQGQAPSPQQPDDLVSETPAGQPRIWKVS
jgi:hypothetical protein